MTYAAKATLFSALGFPGAGHFYLKRYTPAILYSLIAAASFFVLVSCAIKRANIIAEKIVNGTVPLDLGVIMQLIHQAPAAGEATSINIATYALVIVWVVAALDAYRIGSKEDAS